MDTQKETYRKYLESAGVIDALTKVLVSLYEEPDKPKSAIDYVKACLGGPTPADYDALIAERESLKKELEDARQQIAELQAKVQT
ncbi:hypothetical protein COO60DRAFT_511621 [Scenedesmus sp. NREL 46B-D3]|nr:hypothetical protein COO60DRAFT_511621 [Scenedesmus sp. NREL 46B-D3]